MNFKINSIASSLRKAYLKQDVAERDFNQFIQSLNEFFKKYNMNESEEHQKNDIAEFLRNTFYKDTNRVNTKGRIDLAIYNGISNSDSVGVLIEVKRSGNKSEMLTRDNPNQKALHEAISYYLEESITNKNKDIKHIIITNSEEWFIFDGAEFERAFYKNSHLIQKFTHHREDLFGVNTTGWFYTYLRNEIVPKIEELNYTYFNLFEYKDKIVNPGCIDEMILLFKILSPEHLLKKPFANDSNTLDTQFYDELLHLLGLEEVKDAGKKVLLRLPEKKRFDGNMLENTIRILKVNNSLDNVNNLIEFGANEEVQLFSVGLELCITWLNRILFLKLLESQLIKFNNNDYAYKFLTVENIKDFDELNELFFEVLAVKPNDRAQQDRHRFEKIPYLNSSLFEQTALEKATINISALKDRYTIPIYPKTVLKTISGDRRNGELKFQEYLFEFLDAYNFASVSKATIQEDNKTIINSSVLGLIFEKLNGYKDGSYFTPGYITMYMCREAISLAVVNKFNESYNWDCKTLTDVYNKLDNSTEKLVEYNSVVNSIRLVDPAVGSGHFLVSALNEFINIKAELGILLDKNGRRLRDYKFYIENDELIILDCDDHIFSYLSPEKVSGAKRDELQKVQETIFHEKQTIIENCLFGVDINPKSVSISRLRLWVELLKFMYYKPDGNNGYELETLPNIDINIKSGNSLVSRFPIDENGAFSVADARIIPFYKQAVQKYKNVKNYKEKRKILNEIDNCKSQLRGMINAKSAIFFKLKNKRDELTSLISQTDLFGEKKSKKEEKEFAGKVSKLTEEIHRLEQEAADLDSNDIYRNAFEWRFEFPEALDDNGNFIGFDVVIGNPPYIQLQRESGSLAIIFEKMNYETFAKTGDIYALFFEKGISILNNEGLLTLITSNKWMRAGYGESLRNFIAAKTSPYKLIDFGGFKVFESATVDTNILITKKNISQTNKFYACSIASDFNIATPIHLYFEAHRQLMPYMNKDAWVISSGAEQKIKEKIEAIGTPLKDWDINIYRGVLTGLNEAFIIDGKTKDKLIAQDPKSSEILKPILRGRDIKRYKAEFADRWIIMFPKGFTIKSIQNQKNERTNIVSEPMPRYGYEEYDKAWNYIKVNYPAIANHLINYRDKAEKRDDKGDYWWELRACAYLEEFEKEKIAWASVGETNFTFIPMNTLLLDTNYLAVFKESNINKYVLTLLNSTLLVYFLNTKDTKVGSIAYRHYKYNIETVPIPKISPEAQKPFISLVDKILAKKAKAVGQTPSSDNNYDTDTTAEEREIDLMVYKLYELTYDEVKIIEPDFAMSREEYENFKMEE